METSEVWALCRPLNLPAGYSPILELHLNGLWRWWVPDVNEVGEDRLGLGRLVQILRQTKLGPVFASANGQANGSLGTHPSLCVGRPVAARLPDARCGFWSRSRFEPLWGVSLRTQASILSSETVLMFPWNAERNYLASDDQGHFQFGRYQEALGRRHEGTQPAGAWVPTWSNKVPWSNWRWAPKYGQIDEITLGLSGVWGPDQTPVLLGEDAAYRPFMTSLGLDWRPNSCPTWGCGQLPEEALFSRRKVSSLTVDATWGFGLAIVKMEWLHYLAEIPNMGKTLWLLNDLGLRSASAAYDAASVALESGLGEWVEGSLGWRCFAGKPSCRGAFVWHRAHV